MADIATEDGEHIPHLELSQFRYRLSLSEEFVPKHEKDELIKRIRDAIVEHDMAPFYEIVAAQFKWPIDNDLLTKMKQANAKKLEELEAKIKDAEENLGESEVREALQARADHYCRIGNKTNAESAYRAAYEKTVPVGQKLDIVFVLIRLGFFYNDPDLITRNIQKGEELIENGGDWDRRNRLKVYKAVYYASIRKFKKSAMLFLDSLATFTSYELFTYKDYIWYTVIVSMLELDRVMLKDKVIEAPEVLSVIDSIPNLRPFLNSIYDSNYSLFFHTLADATDSFKRDRYFGPHSQYMCREFRIAAYSQLLESYRSVTLSSMAHQFGITTEFLDKELSRFIALGRLHCKIDKVHGIVETNRPDSKNALYQSTIKHGDLLLNRIQKLSRVINI